MSTLLDVLNSIRTELSSQLSLTTQFSADYGVDLEKTSGTAYRIRHQYQQAFSNANVTYKAAAIEIEIAHRLSDPFDERAYTEGAMLVQQAILLDRIFWRSLTGVYQPEEGPDMELDVERVGNVIHWSVLCTLTITP